MILEYTSRLYSGTSSLTRLVSITHFDTKHNSYTIGKSAWSAMIWVMIIQYPTSHTWVKSVVADPLTGFGKNHTVRIKNTLKKITESNVTYRIEPLTPAIIDWFTPLYTEMVGEKSNAKISDIYTSTLGKEANYPYNALILLEAGIPIGATIFSERKATLSFAYRIYPNHWQHNSLPAGPSLYAEYIINDYASQKQFAKISHGKDRNPYGYNAGIGLALFKLSVGCSIYLPNGQSDTASIDLDAVTDDILVFAYPQADIKQISQAYLCVGHAAYEKYHSITKYDHLVHTTIRLRD